MKTHEKNLIPSMKIQKNKNRKIMMNKLADFHVVLPLFTDIVHHLRVAHTILALR